MSARCPFRIQLITSAAFADDVLVARARELLAHFPRGSVSIHVRDRARAEHEVKNLAERMALVCAAAGAMLIVNRLVDVAVELGAGLHLGKPDSNTSAVISYARAAGISWFSLSAHTDDEVRVAVEHGVSAVLVSPIFATQSGALTNAAGDVSLKEPRGLDALQRAAALAQGRLAIVALGGIDAERARECFDSGADAVSTMSQWTEGPVGRFVVAPYPPSKSAAINRLVPKVTSSR